MKSVAAEQQDDDMHLDRPAFAHRVDLLVGLSLEVHAVGVDAKQGGEVTPKFLLPRPDLRSFENHGRIEVADLEARLVDPATGGLEKDPAVGAVVGGIGVRKELADVILAQGTEQGVGDRVQQGVAIGVADRPAIMFEGEPAEHERPAGAIRGDRFEAVEVISMTDSEGRGGLRHHFRL